MQSYEFTGWVVRVNRVNQYGPEFVLRADEDEKDVKYPQHILIAVSRKKAAQLPPEMNVDDKVKVKFLPILQEGVSERTNRAYAISKNQMMSVEILEKSKRAPAAEVADDDIPF